MKNYNNIFEKLLKAETEKQVDKIIRTEPIFKNEKNWQNYGDISNNWGSAGGQQDESTAALVEKLTNSIDALLLYKCRVEGIDPRSEEAPKDIFSAAEEFFGVKKTLALLGNSRRICSIRRWTMRTAVLISYMPFRFLLIYPRICRPPG